MYPLQRSNELVIQFSNGGTADQKQHNISQDLILNHSDSPNSNIFQHKKLLVGGSSCRPSKKLYYGAAEADHNKEKEKMVHREIERQRRQEMSTLHASLRSLIPLHFIKGKRSVSDQMNEAVNYIRQLQRNIKELSAKRDELKKVVSNNVSDIDEKHEENKHSDASSGTFTVHQSNDGAVGIEINCGCCFREGKVFPLSKLLEVLFQEGLEVVSCFSTEINGRLLHSLHCEVKNSNSVDLSELRRKFVNVIPSFRCSN